MVMERRKLLKLTSGVLGSAAVGTSGLPVSGRAPSDDGYSIYSDLNTPVSITGDELDAAIRAVSPGSRLIGLGQTFVNVQERDGTNAVYQAAHAAHESAWGRSRIARSKNNIYGWSAFDRCPGACADSFESYSACVRQVQGYINDSYLTSGGTFYEGATLEDMNVHYATDPRWAEKIAAIMRQLDAYLDTSGGGTDKRQPAFQVGEAVVASELVNIRSAPEFGDNVVVSYPKHSTGIVVDGPKRVDGAILWKVEYDDDGATAGWSRQKYLRIYGNGGGQYRFPIDSRVQSTDILNVRRSAGNDGVVTFTVKRASPGYVTRGPVLADDRIWYQVHYNAGVKGWSRAGSLVSAPLIDDDAAFVPDNRVRMKHDAVYHTRPAPESTIVEQVPANEFGYVRDGPVEQGGYTWWFVDFNTGHGGWMNQEHIENAALPAVEEGSRVELVRDAAGHYYAGPDKEVAKVFDRSTEGYAREGPIGRKGYDWWKVELNTGETAWFADKHLAVDTTVFDWDDPVEPVVSTNVHWRNAEDSEVAMVAGTDTLGRIRLGPVKNTDDGHTWWKVQFPELTGWVVQENLEQVPEPDDGGGGTNPGASGIVWPLSGEVTSGFYDTRLRNGRRVNHKAVDIGAEYGTPITAAYPGTVSVVAGGGSGGKKVFVTHTNGYRTEYHHLSDFAVGRGASVNQGDVIGYVGESGRSTGPHLHFEVVQNEVNQFIPGSPGDIIGKGDSLPATYDGL